MKKLIALIVMLAARPAFCQTITRVQHISGDSGSSSVSSQATSNFATNPVQNNLLVAGGGNRSSGKLSSCSDTLGNTWTVAQAVTFSTTVNAGVCWAIQSKTTGTDAVTCTASAAGIQFFCGAAEYSVTTSWPATPTDGGNAAGNNSGNPSTGNFTTTGTDVIFSEMDNSSNSQSCSAGSGYTLLDSAPSTTNCKGTDEDDLNAASGTHAGTFTIGGSIGWAVAAEAFKPNPPSGSCTPTLPLMKVGRCG